MHHPDDFGNQDEWSRTCVYCTNADGSVKSCEEIFDSGVTYFMKATSSDRLTAEKLVRKNMLQLPHWQGVAHTLLEWPVATDEEFAAAMGNL